ncbi:hypothetical protein BDW59DRAFT_147952 [Aspergillus cavernicola]|uniref:Uncharacterized protein n=1 Tax=Aspergillus cavernicola TaxID=176166 RepID=A0ABR4IA79_9EURO
MTTVLAQGKVGASWLILTSGSAGTGINACPRELNCKARSPPQACVERPDTRVELNELHDRHDTVQCAMPEWSGLGMDALPQKARQIVQSVAMRVHKRSR